MTRESAVIQAALNAGKSYATLVQDQPKDHDKGPPHIHVWLALITAIIGEGEKVGALNHKKLKEYDEVVSDATITQIGDEVR
eukprot:8354306-Alexandrium_andersonii.AAC.1